MGSNDQPPAHITFPVVATTSLLLQIGGILWTLCYILMLRESQRSKTYGMPLFALSFNFSWELVYALYVAESLLERIVFTTWMVLDIGLIYYTLLYGKREWDHAPFIRRHLGLLWVLMTVYTTVGHFAFAKWWLDNDIGKKEGRFYRGIVGPDTTELGFWTSVVSQAYLSAASLIQLLIRRHSGGVNWSIWATRTIGSITGLYLNFGTCWYFWRESNEYFMSPFSIFLWGTGLICDLAYPFVLYKLRRTERVGPDGSKTAGDNSISTGRKTR
ncbi:hypothetical protein B0O99DRAFT_654043 [Bisporella sp. PMI_857]|nr:hypothetical protein B0O99DRAFT_654043 [Bisporella sp. PMI_857]